MKKIFFFLFLLHLSPGIAQTIRFEDKNIVTKIAVHSKADSLLIEVLIENKLNENIWIPLHRGNYSEQLNKDGIYVYLGWDQKNISSLPIFFQEIPARKSITQVHHLKNTTDMDIKKVGIQCNYTTITDLKAKHININNTKLTGLELDKYLVIMQWMEYFINL